MTSRQLIGMIARSITTVLNHNKNKTIRNTQTPITRGRKDIFYLTTHSTHFILWRHTYGKGPLRFLSEETRCCHMGYSFRLAASHRQDNTYHGLCYTSRGALAGTRNNSMGPPHEGSIRRPIAP